MEQKTPWTAAINNRCVLQELKSQMAVSCSTSSDGELSALFDLSTVRNWREPAETELLEWRPTDLEGPSISMSVYRALRIQGHLEMDVTGCG
jgi:hypothetical protein